ncbi:MAG: DUF87 domain-containing protein [Planctomycetota bacterium]|nr:MAG: DUF87 domain-containing protein [Planctomycetota bacterium]
MSLTSDIKDIASVDIFTEAKESGAFVGRPFHIDYEKAYILVADAWKQKIGGIPQGTFLLAFYENEPEVNEALLLRAIAPTKLPTDDAVISSMIEYYKDNLKTAGEDNQLDDFTRYEFSFSGLECRILGTFYKDQEGKTQFGADVENFYSSHNYQVFKSIDNVLEVIANFREETHTIGSRTDVKIGKVRYSSSKRFQENQNIVPVYVTSQDFLGKRTSLFGMTRTGKSNTVKKIIQAIVSISSKAQKKVAKPKKSKDKDEDFYKPYDEKGYPKFKVGQIIFDVNGEYANANMQDEGTAIFEQYKDDVTRYSVRTKEGFKVMKVNFFRDVSSGFELVRAHLSEDGSDYVGSFTSIDLEPPDDPNDRSAVTRHERKLAAYLCCLKNAGFKEPRGFKVKFSGNKDINKEVKRGGIDPLKRISLDDAITWFEWVWENYDSDFFQSYKRRKGREWADEDLKALLVFLTRRRQPGRVPNLSGFRKLRRLIDLHTETVDEPFEKEIIKNLREGSIIIVDLSQGDPDIQRLFSERICLKIFQDAMARFVQSKPNNFIQFYFEEAHNLFPKKEDKDLSQIYNRLAKEGAKLNIGITYATQEVSSISANILKNTQNWFVAHLNNEDELKEIRKYYDYADFTESLVRFSADNDKGFIRMKTYSNPYIVPVQVDRFTVSKKGSK